MRNVLAYAKDFGALIVHHLEDPTLAEDGVMNEGEVATRLGLPGIPRAAETIMLERDMRLVELTGGRYHAGQISCRAALDVIRAAKARGLPVTCGVSINHLTLNENDIGPYRTFFKMKPPLRSEDDRRAMVEGVASGDIDVIVSATIRRTPTASAGPSPRPPTAPSASRPCWPPRCASITTAGRALHAASRADGQSGAAARACSGRLAKGAPADLVLIDLDTPWVVEAGTSALEVQEHAVRRGTAAGPRTADLVAGASSTITLSSPAFSCSLSGV